VFAPACVTDTCVRADTPMYGGRHASSSKRLVAYFHPVSLYWIAIAFWPARIVASKGHSFFGYLIFSLIFFPAALIVALMVSDRRIAATA
jgi:hypothetical protein